MRSLEVPTFKRLTTFHYASASPEAGGTLQSSMTRRFFVTWRNLLLRAHEGTRSHRYGGLPRAFVI